MPGTLCWDEGGIFVFGRFVAISTTYIGCELRRGIESGLT